MNAQWPAKAFVTLIFVVLGASFVLETAWLFYEFDDLAMAMATFDAELFIFFPLAGLAALAAFWRAGVVLTDLYWRRLRNRGRAFFAIGLAAAGFSAFYIAESFQLDPSRSWWEVAPQALAADAGAPAGCEPGECDRAPVIDAHQSVRWAAREPTGLASFTLNCTQEPLTRFRASLTTESTELYCFASGAPMSQAECCAARAGFRDAVNALHAEAPSQLHYVHRIALPLKVFFLIMLLGIGLLLLRRRAALERWYAEDMTFVERNIPFGGALMLLWPLMNQAYLQAWSLLYGAEQGSAYSGAAPLYTLGFGAWFLVLIFYYFRRYPDTMELFAKVFGVVLAAVGIAQYDQIISYVSRFAVAGAGVVPVAVLGVVVVGVFLQMISSDEHHDEDDGDERGDRDRLVR